jgi:hypothetical protein
MAAILDNHSQARVGECDLKANIWSHSCLLDLPPGDRCGGRVEAPHHGPGTTSGQRYGKELLMTSAYHGAASFEDKPGCGCTSHKTGKNNIYRQIFIVHISRKIEDVTQRDLERRGLHQAIDGNKCFWS